jgi:hypothetical protein
MASLTVLFRHALETPMRERVAGRIVELVLTELVGTAIAIREKDAETADSAEVVVGAVFMVFAGAVLTVGAGATVGWVGAFAFGIGLAVERTDAVERHADFAAPGAQGRLTAIDAQILICAAACVGHAAGSAVIAAVRRAFLVVAVEHAGPADAQLAVAAVVVVVDADPTLAIGALPGTRIALILTQAARDVADLAAEAAILPQIAIGDTDHIVETAQAGTAIVVVVASAVGVRRAGAATADRAGRAIAGRIGIAIGNIRAVELAEDVLGAFLAGTAEVGRVGYVCARAVRAAEGPAAVAGAIENLAAVVSNEPLVAVEDAVPRIAAETGPAAVTTDTFGAALAVALAQVVAVLAEAEILELRGRLTKGAPGTT